MKVKCLLIKGKMLLVLMIFLMSLNNTVYSQKKEKAPKNNVLDGMAFTITMESVGGKKKIEEKDDISFKNAKFTSKVNGEYGFGASVYNVEVDSSNPEVKIYSFEVEQTNDKGDISKWEGNISNGEIEGTMTITNKKGKVTDNYKFTGTLKAAPNKGGAKAAGGKEKAKEAGVLDNKVYVVTIKIEGKKAEEVKDEFTFKQSKFSSKYSQGNKFLPAVYNVTDMDTLSADKSYTVEIEQQNDSKETLKWELNITNDEIEGTGIWATPKKTKAKYSVTGELKTKGKKK